MGKVKQRHMAETMDDMQPSLMEYHQMLASTLSKMALLEALFSQGVTPVEFRLEYELWVDEQMSREA